MPKMVETAHSVVLGGSAHWSYLAMCLDLKASMGSEKTAKCLLTKVLPVLTILNSNNKECKPCGHKDLKLVPDWACYKIISG